MKKAVWTAAAFLASAWMALFPASVSADDLRLPSGEVLPFGAGVNVWADAIRFLPGR